MGNKVLKIAVHDGGFHSDDVFAVAILTLIYSKYEIFRTRNEGVLRVMDLRVDVGGRYNPATGFFDHHQKEFTKTRNNEIPYASAGLIWKSFGGKLVNSKEAFDYIDRKIMQPIDADDNGISLCTGDIVPYSIQNIVSTFSPIWNLKNPNYDDAFNDAVSFVKELLKKEIEGANSLKNEEEFVKKLVNETAKEYLIFESLPPSYQSILRGYPKIKYVISKSVSGNWNSEACRIKENSFEVIKYFPNEWAGLTNEKLAKVTEVSDAVFCHRGLFIVVAKSKEGIIKLTELALKA